MVKTDGMLKVLDFRLAKVVEAPIAQSADSPTITEVIEAGAIMGTVAYMSPEQARSKPIDEHG